MKLEVEVGRAELQLDAWIVPQEKVPGGRAHEAGGGLHGLCLSQLEVIQGWTDGQGYLLEDSAGVMPDFDWTCRVLALVAWKGGTWSLGWRGFHPFWLFHDLAHVQLGHLIVDEEKRAVRVFDGRSIWDLEREADVVGAAMAWRCGIDVRDELRKLGELDGELYRDRVNRNGLALFDVWRSNQ